MLELEDGLSLNRVVNGLAHKLLIFRRNEIPQPGLLGLRHIFERAATFQLTKGQALVWRRESSTNRASSVSSRLGPNDGTMFANTWKAC
ncbi:hypothetical protein AWB74_07335 [Caballeronia arvi]|uniref:Uncharacterized protein n=1 Tax=Caballeronia arvi TaxID=1777135 RepID=A0A158KY25_9BURK|nr:hypothetical protein AWB74_07335 [Caballeronia arvi]